MVASGDLRNVVKTVVDLPENCQNSLSACLKDKDMDIVARNAILLLVFMTVEDSKRAADCALHLWYSTMVTQSCVDILRDTVFPLIDDICNKISNKASTALLGKTWVFDKRRVRMVLTKSQWLTLREHTKVPSGLDAGKAKDIRDATTSAPERIDYVERHLFAQKPATRLCMHKFREDGLLLPFGHPRDEFNTPNP